MYNNGNRAGRYGGEQARRDRDEEMRERVKTLHRLGAQRGFDYVLRTVCPSIADAIDNPKRHFPCPRHGGRNGDAFRAFKDVRETGRVICNTCGHTGDFLDTIRFVTEWPFPQILEEVEAVLGVTPGAPRSYAPPPRSAPPPPKPKEKDDEFILSQWDEAVGQSVGLGHPLAEPARQYLKRRGLVPLEGPLSDIRVHPNLKYWDQVKQEDGKFAWKLLGEYPAMVTAVRQPDGQISTYHRTYLSQDGNKAPVPKVKKQMATPSYRSLDGSMTRLDDLGPVLHLCEGLENALAVRIINSGLHHCHGSTLNERMMREFVAPPGVKIVCFWGDHDASGVGQHAAKVGAENVRSQGLRSIVVLPTYALRSGEDDIDWDIVLNRFGAAKIREHQMYRSLLAILNKECTAAGIPNAMAPHLRSVS